MSKIRPNTIGYHTNDSHRVEKFIANKVPIKAINDTHWVGDGMYFWENMSDAIYWKDEKFRKHKEINKISIAKVNIFLDEEKVLDLVDRKQAETFDKIWKSYSEKKGYTNEEANNIPIGRKINELFDFLDFLNETYKVIRCAGKYVRQDANVFKFTKNCRITQDLKIIYCVRDEEMIIHPRLEKEFER